MSLVEEYSIIETLDLLVREVDIERLKVLVQVLDLAPTNDREHVWRLLHDPCNRDRSDVLRPDLLRDLLELEADLALLGRAPPVVEHLAPLLARLSAALLLSVGANLASREDVPGRDSHAWCASTSGQRRDWQRGQMGDVPWATHIGSRSRSKPRSMMLYFGW